MKEQKRDWVKIVVIILAIAFLVLWLSKSYISPDIKEKTNLFVKDEVEIAGLQDAVEVGDLSFELVGVTLQKRRSWITAPFGNNKWHPREEVPPEYHTMFWDFTIINNGNNIENISDCGRLLFEDGSQYEFEISVQFGFDITRICNYYDMVPGARAEITSTFHFSNPSEVPSYWSGSPMFWKDVPGSKITYFSQQEQGLVMYEVNKEEITYNNITWSPREFGTPQLP